MVEGNQSLRVFISYARRDCSAFAEELLAGLELAGFDPFLDRHDIAAGEDWEARLSNLIQSADTIVFVVSPAAVKSERCAWELKKARSLSKRIIPVVAINVAEADTPEDLRRLNYIFFSEGHGVMAALGQLSKALRTDVDWIREHTRLTELAERWLQRGKAEPLLLRGSELEGAKLWLSGWKAPAPQPTELHRDFIGNSEDVEKDRYSAERQRLEDMAKVQAEKERALFRLRRALVIAGVITIVFLGATVAGGVHLWRLNGELTTARGQIVSKEKDIARAKFDLALTNADLETTKADLKGVAAKLEAVQHGGGAVSVEVKKDLQDLSRRLAAPTPAAPAPNVAQKRRDERRLSANYTLAEFTASDTALRTGIDNTPDEAIVERLRETAQNLERIRDYLGCPIRISRGFNSPALSEKLGSASTSAHVQGYAVDVLCPQWGTPYGIAKRIAASPEMMNMVDQLTLENGQWVHISFDPRRRKQVLTTHYRPGGGRNIVYSQGIIPLTSDGFPAADASADAQGTAP